MVGSLLDGPHRFSVIAQRIDGVSQKLLTQTLRGLERDGLVKRTVYPVVPPRVEYELTGSGKSLGEPLAALEAWAKEHMAGIIEARETYDQTAADTRAQA